MAPSDETAAQGAEKAEWFDATHWSVVLKAADLASDQSHAALSKLCQTYWYPLYVFVRRQGQGPENAQDLVQSFFATVLEKNYLQAAKPERGKFRSFLLMALKRFMANEWDRANRLKRGGGHQLLSLDEQNTEVRYKLEPADEATPEKAFERNWALALLDQVLSRLEGESSAVGKKQLFEELKPVLSGEKSAKSYAEIGARLGMSEGAVKVAVHRLRQRYREILRLEIANTVGSPEEIDDEIRHLFAALG
ncbi:MAG: RNA polymerase subunit sigma-24 [Verrucomicrobia bacterium]|nr:MAG: RNA polymerase subunit sigma-24 [Verrucomicrobiota bacterium]